MKNINLDINVKSMGNPIYSNFNQIIIMFNIFH